MSDNEYRKDRLTFFKWLTSSFVGGLILFGWFAWEKLDNIENQVTSLVAAQPFILSNIDDTNKKIDSHILSEEANNKRQDDEISESRKIFATIPNRIKLKNYNE